MPKGRVLKAQSRQLVLKLHEYFEQENQNGGPLLPITQVRNRVAAALGISLSTVTKITTDAYGRSGLEQNIPSTPKRKRRAHELVSPAHVLSQPTVTHPAQQPPPQPPPSSQPAQHGPLPTGTPTRQAPPRLLNPGLNNPVGVTLARTAPRPVRPRRPALRSPMSTPPLAQPRLLNPQHQQATVGVGGVGGGRGLGVSANVSAGNGRGLAGNVASAVGVGRGVRPPRPSSARVLNPHAAHAQHRPPRPRTPLLAQPFPQQQQQQKHQQQHQLAQHVLNHPQQVQQLNQLKLATQQVRFGER